MRAFVQLWDEITRERYGVEDEKMRRFRYGVQVNSLGLTEAQPENNVQRIVLEMLGVTLSKNARARAVQLPAWNEALGLPRPWDQQWSLRLQQVLAFESDLLEYDDIFDGSHVIEAKVASLVEGAKAEIDRVQAMGGAIAAVESGYMKQALRQRPRRPPRPDRGRRRDHRRRQQVRHHRAVAADRQPRRGDHGRRPAGRGSPRSTSVADWKAQRDEAAVTAALATLAADAKTDKNLMHATLAAARAGATTGEWAGTLREVFGEFRAPTGVSGAVGVAEAGAELTAVRDKVRATGEELGGRLRLLVGKPGLDGHSNGAEQVAVRARDAGFEVIYQGIRLTPDQIVAAAVAEDVHCVGLSILSGSHMELVPDVLDGLRAAGLEDVPVIVGGIIPESDGKRLIEQGVAAVYTPKDFGLTEIMGGIVDVIRRAQRPRLSRARRSPAVAARAALERADHPVGDPAAVEAALLGAHDLAVDQARVDLARASPTTWSRIASNPAVGSA